MQFSSPRRVWSQELVTPNGMLNRGTSSTAVARDKLLQRVDRLTQAGALTQREGAELLAQVNAQSRDDENLLPQRQEHHRAAARLCTEQQHTAAPADARSPPANSAECCTPRRGGSPDPNSAAQLASPECVTARSTGESAERGSQTVTAVSTVATTCTGSQTVTHSVASVSAQTHCQCTIPVGAQTRVLCSSSVGSQTDTRISSAASQTTKAPLQLRERCSRQRDESGAALAAAQSALAQLLGETEALRAELAAARHGEDRLRRLLDVEREAARLPAAEQQGLATKRIVLSAHKSSIFQPELKQSVVDSRTVDVAQLQRELAALQAQVDLSARNAAAARQDALRAGLRLWRDEEQGRGDLLFEMSNEWEARVLALHAPSCDQDGDSATDDCTPTLDGGDGAVALSSTTLPNVDTPGATGPRQPSQAGTVLEIDHVAHWVALFVRRDWAPVSSAAARSVAGVVKAERDIWWSAFVSIGFFQSVGFEHATDTKYFGPEFGPLRTARQDFDQLAEDVMAFATPCCMRWFNRWRIGLLLTANMYEEMRLRHRELYGAAREVIGDLNGVLGSLDAALEMYDRRVSEEAVGEAG